MEPLRADPFDALYRETPDPWGTHTRWYEERKRNLVIATLSRRRFHSAFEAGCGTGHLTRDLASRCDRLLACDGSREAVTLATRLVSDRANVTVEHRRLPDDWPAEAFELVVLAEVIYFVDATRSDEIAQAARTSVGDGGLVVACNWRATIESRGCTGEEAHRRFGSALDLPNCFEYADADFILSGWSASRSSVAELDGLR